MATTEPTPRASPPPLPGAPFEQVDEFPEKLSPMLVKELRQGLRTHTFTVTFLLLQGILALVLLTAGPIAASEESLSGSTGAFVSKVVFCTLGLGLLVVQPLRGISAVATEIKQNTIDLILLTRLTAWKIVWGKWIAIVSQSTLILLAILPYLIFRYFFGGMQLVAELTLLAYLFCISGALTALTVGLSAIGSVLVRGLVVVGGAACLLVYIPFFFTPGLDRFIDALNFTDPRLSLAALGALFFVLYAGYFFLELGCTAIAPAAENRATRKRLTGLAVMILSFLLIQLVQAEAAVLAALFIVALISLDLFTERPEFPAIVCRPFLRFGSMGRLLGRFLYPGWATGTLFFLGLVGTLLLLIQLTAPGTVELFTIATIGFGVMLFPAAVIQIFARASADRFSIYVMLSLVSAFLTGILAWLYTIVEESFLLWIFSFVPLVLLPIRDQLSTVTNPSTLLVFSLALSSIYLLIVLAGALPRLAKISKTEMDAQAEMEN